MCVCVYIYIYIYPLRDREFEFVPNLWMVFHPLATSGHIHIHTYIHTLTSTSTHTSISPRENACLSVLIMYAGRFANGTSSFFTPDKRFSVRNCLQAARKRLLRVRHEDGDIDVDGGMSERHAEEILSLMYAAREKMRSALKQSVVVRDVKAAERLGIQVCLCVCVFVHVYIYIYTVYMRVCVCLCRCGVSVVVRDVKAAERLGIQVCVCVCV
jgi:hypothetical protein